MFDWLVMFVSCGLFVFFFGMIWIDYACKMYFEHKLNHFRRISSEMTKFNPRQGEANGQE
jgi:hypothetical protein